MSLPTVVASLGVLLAASGASAQDGEARDPVRGPTTDRQDVARSYQLYEQALADNPPQGDDLVYHGRRFDWLSRLVFRRQWSLGVQELDRLTELVLPPELNSPAHRAARATDVTAVPPVVIAADGAEVTFQVTPIYNVERAPQHLQMTVLAGDEVVETFGFPPGGAKLDWQPPAGLTGRLSIEVGPMFGDISWPRGHVDVLDRKPSAVKSELLARLDTLANDVEPDSEL
ncbi:MAG: hypothetical protein AAGK78_09020, partial [Planctomycetota bacterium]